MPRLTVLLPVKDGVATVAHAVRSTLRAAPRDTQLVVVDDGSSDGTDAVLDRLRAIDSRVVVRRHDEPLGVAASLNEALAATDSDVVARMDADDVTLPWRFRVQLPALARADHVFGSMLLIDGRGRLIGASNPAPVSARQAPLRLLLENPFAHPTLVARRSALVSLGGYRATPVEDYDLWLRAAAAGHRLRRLVMPVLAYRRHPGQATAAWVRDTDDPLLDESYGALLPESLRDRVTPLRRAAVARDPRAASAAERSALRHHLDDVASTLGRGSAPALRRAARAALPA